MLSIPKALSHKLLGLSQLVLSHMECGRSFEAKCSLMHMAAIIDLETDRLDETERWQLKKDTGYC